MPKDRPWWQKPRVKAMTELVEIRNELRAKNLHDTEDGPLTGGLPPLAPNAPERGERTLEGNYNDLKCPAMGAVGRRFGRNAPLAKVHPDNANLLNPNPRDVSRKLMTRDQFQPVPFLNLLAASWIQFQTHDWFSHGRDDSSANPRFEIPLAPGDPWPEHPMTVPHTPADPTRQPGDTKPPTYVNHVTHWWDGSQIYGCSPAENQKLRTGVDGKMRVGADGKLPLDPATGIDLTGFIDNWWLGLSMLHAIFVLEHNSICDRLKSKHPDWTDAQLFGKARLINAALMAKIHTVEWTPSILPHPVVQKAMRTNWWGFLGEFGDQLQKLFPGINDSELVGGIIGSKQDHHTAPYSLTEEFVSVYRMHPLLPDVYQIHSAASGKSLAVHTLPQVAGRASRAIFDQFSMTDLFYSFGSVMKPGMIQLHNFPFHLQNLTRDDGSRFDLAVVDILRDRERGVPRYNDFREMLRLPRIQSFDELTDNKVWREEIRQVYGGNLDLIDTQVGLMCEPLPPGFGFSETAFRVFVLMASRRLKSDRFFTDDFRPEIYTPEGIDWVQKNGFKDVLTRHFPALAPALEDIDNPFHPWRFKNNVNGHWQDPD